MSLLFRRRKLSQFSLCPRKLFQSYKFESQQKKNSQEIENLDTENVFVSMDIIFILPILLIYLSMGSNENKSSKNDYLKRIQIHADEQDQNIRNLQTRNTDLEQEIENIQAKINTSVSDGNKIITVRKQNFDLTEVSTKREEIKNRHSEELKKIFNEMEEKQKKRR